MSTIRATVYRVWGYWPKWAAYAASAWSLGYSLLGLYWSVGGVGYPFGKGDANHDNSFLGGLQAGTGAPIMAFYGFLAAIVAWLMARSVHRGFRYWMNLMFAAITTLVLLFVIPDGRVMMAAGYIPLFAVGLPFGWPPVSFMEKALPWPVLNQLVCMIGGFLWLGATVAYRRRIRQACGNCGRTESAKSGWTSQKSAARWRKPAVYIAVIIPLYYASIRWLWAFGVPWGIDRETFQLLHETSLWVAGAALATVAACGSLLTLGLIQQWGEVFPRWLPGLAGKRVPPALAVLPASFVSIMIITNGLTTIHMDGLQQAFSGNWLLKPRTWLLVWGAALGVAALAYFYRRRGPCSRCGRFCAG